MWDISYLHPKYERRKEMSHFYLTLPSNSSSKYFHENTLTRFTTKLLGAVSLSGDWEVGLSEIIYPHTWLTVDRGDALFSVSCATSCTLPNSDLTVPPYNIELRIPYGYYDSVHDIVREINKTMSKILPYANIVAVNKDENQMPKLKYNESSKRVHFVMFRGQSLNFSSTLATILGVSAKQNPSKPRDEDTFGWFAGNVSDITKGINYIMLYCDLLEHVPVGDTKAPLLRIVDATGVNGEIIHRSFDEPRYIPLQRKNFDSIEIDLRDDLGNPIAFENGKLVVTLHFRQTKSSYYLG